MRPVHLHDKLVVREVVEIILALAVPQHKPVPHGNAFGRRVAEMDWVNLLHGARHYRHRAVAKPAVLPQDFEHAMPVNRALCQKLKHPLGSALHFAFFRAHPP